MRSNDSTEIQSTESFDLVGIANTMRHHSRLARIFIVVSIVLIVGIWTTGWWPLLPILAVSLFFYAHNSSKFWDLADDVDSHLPGWRKGLRRWR